MLGRTHMGIGAIGAVVASPFVLHSSWEPMRQLVTGNWNAVPHVIEAQATLVVASVVGSLMPDLDQPDSKMARKVETLGQIIVMGIIIALIIMLHLETSIRAWVFAIIIGVLVGAKGNATRYAGLGVIAAGVLYEGLQKHIPMAAAVLLVVWIVGAMFTKHRTFTHSLLGLFIFAISINMLAHSLSRIHLELAVSGLILGYALHMAADAIAGGVPLLWPWNKRQGIRLVKTDSGLDYLIGGAATLGFIALAVF